MVSFQNTDRILIAGSTGFIGRHLVDRCLKDTSRITCIGFPEHDALVYLKWKGIKYFDIDLCDSRALKLLLSQHQFDYVFNVSGYIDHSSYFAGGRKAIESHFIGLLNLVSNVPKDTLKCFVQIGSSDEYGNTPAPQKETDREKPISSYSLGKVAATHFIQMLSTTENFPGVVIRLFLPYGPGQGVTRFLPQIIRACLRNEEFKTSEGSQKRDFCYIDDVIEGMIKAALNSETKGHIINIASGAPVTIKSVINKVIDLVGGGNPIWGAHKYRKGEAMELYADIKLAADILHWTPSVSFHEGLIQTIDYYKNNRT
ncbi:MAG: NAD-dependent epimerase/dehydratase family protein [bacterium]